MVLVVKSIARIDIQKLPVQENRAVCRIMLVNSHLGRHVEKPDDVRVRLGHLQRLITARRHMPAFVFVWPIVAVGLAVEVEAHYFPAIAHDVNPVAFNSSRRTITHSWPIHVEGVWKLGNDELPAKAPILLV